MMGLPRQVPKQLYFDHDSKATSCYTLLFGDVKEGRGKWEGDLEDSKAHKTSSE